MKFSKFVVSKRCQIRLRLTKTRFPEVLIKTIVFAKVRSMSYEHFIIKSSYWLNYKIGKVFKYKLNVCSLFCHSVYV